MSVVRAAFELTMPGAASWNGKWSGEGRCYCIIKEFPPVQFEKKWKEKVIGTWYYTWDDGWCACVKSHIVDGKESAKLKKKTCGFMGYNWMVDTILSHGKILSTKELNALQAEM